MRNTFSKSEDAVTIRALASQRHVKPVPSPLKGRSSLCSRLQDVGQASVLASLGQVRPVLSPPKGMSSLCSRLLKAGQVYALASRPRRGRMSITAGVVSEANETCGPPECGMIVLVLL